MPSCSCGPRHSTFAHTREDSAVHVYSDSAYRHAFAPHCGVNCHAGALHPDGSPESNGDSHSTLNGYGGVGFVGYSAPNIDRND